MPIACLRVSFADPRERHRGLSHHSATALTIATRSRVLIPVPCVGGEEERGCAPTSRAPASTDRHEIVDVAAGRHRRPASQSHDLHVVSMGRPAADDPVLFEAAAAAGVSSPRTDAGRIP